MRHRVEGVEGVVELEKRDGEIAEQEQAEGGTR